MAAVALSQLQLSADIRSSGSPFFAASSRAAVSSVEMMDVKQPVLEGCRYRVGYESK